MAESNINNTAKKQQQQSKQKNQNRAPNSKGLLRPKPKPKQKGLEVESDNSSSGTHPVGQGDSKRSVDGDSVRGYVQFDNKVRISLDFVTSKDEIGEIRRKLVRELDRVRTLRKRIESEGTKLGNGYVSNKDNAGASGSNKAGNLARVTSEASHVGPLNSRPVQTLTSENKDAEQRTEKTNKSSRNSEFKTGKEENMKSDKKLKPSGGGGGGKKDSGGGREVAGFGSGMDRYPKEFFRHCNDLLARLMRHEYGWVFNSPVDVKKLKLHDYHKIIKHPMDLGTVKTKLSKHLYKSPLEFAKDVRLTFKNAMTYNEKGQDVHFMADLLLNMFEEKWGVAKSIVGYDERMETENDACLPTPTLKKPPAAVHSLAPACDPTPPQRKPSGNRILGGSESSTILANSRSKDEKIANIQGSNISNKPKLNDYAMRDMTYEEKQRLSIKLQNLPSDKLEGVVHIIKERNPEIVKQDEEIEADIESLDKETLWELDRYVTDHEKSMSNNKRKAEVAVQTREETTYNAHNDDMTFSRVEPQEEPEAVDKFAASSSPVQRRKLDNHMSGSSDSSSSSGSSSSSSGSDNDSS